MKKKIAITIDIVLRVGAAFYLYFNPTIGLILVNVFDTADSALMSRIFKNDRMNYNHLDKNLDALGFFVMLLVGIKLGYFLPLFILLVLRYIGQYLFAKTGSERYLIYFPNFFESVFGWLIFTDRSLGWLIIFLLLKLVQEIGLHYLFPLYIHKYGYPKFIQKLGWNSWDKAYTA